MSIRAYFGSNLVLEHIKEAIVIVPAIHFAICIFYQFVYLHVFGNQIYNFSSASDAFILSLGEIIPLYMSVSVNLLMMIAPTICMNIFGYRQRKDIKKEEINEYISVIILFFVSANIAVCFRFFKQNYFDWGAVNIIWVLLAGAIFGAMSHFNRYRAAKIKFVFLIFISVICRAGINAQNDRMLPYGDIQINKRSNCGVDAIILTSIGEYYLVAYTDNKRSLVGK